MQPHPQFYLYCTYKKHILFILPEFNARWADPIWCNAPLYYHYEEEEVKDAIASISCCNNRASTNISRFSPCINSSIAWSVMPTRWSVTRPCGKLYVRMRSDLSPLPICFLSSKLTTFSTCLEWFYHPNSLFLVRV